MGKYKKSDKQLQKELDYFNRIVEMKRSSASTSEISEVLGITKRRVNQIYNQYGNMVPSKAIDLGIDPEQLKHAWVKEDGFSGFVKNPLFSEVNIEKVIDDSIKEMKKYKVKYPKVDYKKSKDGHMLIVDIADAHFGKLASKTETGDTYNLDVAQKRFKEGVEGILQKSNGFNLDKILFIIGNDILHIDTPKRTTTSGTPQDTDGMWHEAFNVAKKSYIEAIEMMMQIAPVEVVFNASNHDYQSGYMLAQVIEAWFKDSQVKFDVGIRHRKYTKYGQSMIMTSHGDGFKEINVSQIAATEEPIMWSKTEYRYCYLHHLHHKIAKDHIGMTVEYLRSPSASDSWHDRNGYIAKPAVDGFIHSKDAGQVARLTHYFN